LAALELTSYEHVYKNKIDYLVGADALVNKGATHTSILHEDGTKTHVFNTHLQAYYTNRDHYAEITLAQCVEFKKFIENQKAKGLIGPQDTIVMCGDFNIPKTQLGEEASTEEARKLQFLYEKMTRILGPQFTFLDYTLKPDGPVHTLSRQNAYNAHLPPSSDNDVNVDMAIVFDPQGKEKLSTAEIELSDIYCDIQLATAHYVNKNATLFSKWLLSSEKTEALNQFNDQVKALMSRADTLQREQGINPMDDPAWFSQALKLLRGPGAMTLDAVKEVDIVDKNDELTSPEIVLAPELESEEDDINPDDYAQFSDTEQSKKKFAKLLQDVSNLHAEIHKNYIDSPEKYEKVFETSLKLKHVLLTAGDEFYSKPATNASMKKFRTVCEHELNTAKNEFEKNATIWSSMSPFIKGVLAFFAALSVIVAALVETKTPHGFRGTFFRPAESEILTDIKKDFVKTDEPEPMDDETGPSKEM
jgi:hypothetical protein